MYSGVTTTRTTAGRLPEPMASTFAVDSTEKFFVPKENEALLNMLHRASAKHMPWHSFILVGPPRSGKRTAMNLVRRAFLKTRGESQINPTVVIDCLSEVEGDTIFGNGTRSDQNGGEMDKTPNVSTPTTGGGAGSRGIQHVRQKLAVLEKDFTTKRLVCVYGVDRMTPDAQRCMLTAMELADATFVLSCEDESPLVPALLSRCERVTMVLPCNNNTLWSLSTSSSSSAPSSTPSPETNFGSKMSVNPESPFDWITQKLRTMSAEAMTNANVAAFFQHLRFVVGKVRTNDIMRQLRTWAQGQHPTPTVSQIIHRMYHEFFVLGGTQGDLKVQREEEKRASGFGTSANTDTWQHWSDDAACLQLLALNLSPTKDVKHDNAVEDISTNNTIGGATTTTPPLCHTQNPQTNLPELHPLISNLDEIVDTIRSRLISLLECINSCNDDIVSTNVACRQLGHYMQVTVCGAILTIIPRLGNTFAHYGLSTAMFEPLYHLMADIRRMALAVTTLVTSAHSLVTVQQYAEWHTCAQVDLNALRQCFEQSRC